jgi:hypothetical protein
VGRFGVIDRFVEKYFDLNWYQYTANNPINFIDINGDYGNRKKEKITLLYEIIPDSSLSF